MIAEFVASIALVIWLYLIFARGAFWLNTERDDAVSAQPRSWPRVAAVVPARNEAETIGATIGSLMRQDYPGAWTIILVDDDSSDGTAEVARRAAAAAPERLHVVTSRGLPPGWTGKLWAVKQGIDAAMALPQPPDYLLLTDADIVHDADSVRRLAAHAQADGLVLTSLMVKLRCESFAERVSIPAFIFFFQMLYPFSWVNRPEHAMAAAAGGCMLVRADALAKAGGIEAIRTALIDDCALAKALKAQGPIWLGLTDRVHSIRPYPAFADIRRMVARSAYAQLHYSPLLLAGTVAGMLLTYLAPPLFALFGSGPARLIGIVTWLIDGDRVRADLAVLSSIALLGHRAACYCAAISDLHPRFRLPICARTGRKLEGAGASQRVGAGMTTAAELRSGKGHRDENFPVASRVISPRHRGPILAFYDFVRTADDIADHATLSPDEKLTHLDRLEATLLGRNDDDAVGVALREHLSARTLVAAPCAGSADRVPHGRDQAALPRLGRPDRLLQLFGDAGRPLRARRARREPRDSGRPTTPCARRCRSSITCRIAGRIIAISTGSIFRSTRLPKRARRSKRSAPIVRRPRCSPASRSLPGAPATRC